MTTATRSIQFLSMALFAISLTSCDEASAPTSEAAATAPPVAQTERAAARSAAAESEGQLAEALSDPDPFARARALGTLLPTLGPESVPEVREALERFRLDLSAVEFELLLRFWARQEPEQATMWTFQHGPPLYRINAIRVAIEIWAEADPTGALAATTEAVKWGEDYGRIAQMALVTGWFRRGDRKELESYVAGIGSSIEQQRATYAYALSLAAADGGDAAIRWAESVPDEDRRYKLTVFRQVIAALTWGDVEAAKRFCEAHCGGAFGKGMREVLIRTRLRNGDDGAAVVEWVAGVPAEGEEEIANKNHSLWVAYSTWAGRQPEQAVAWMEKQVAKPEHGPAVRRLYGEFARQLAKDDPARAITWAEKVEDPADRNLSMVRISRYWLTQDPAAAEAWISQSPLSEMDRASARDTSKPLYLPHLLGR